MDSESLKKHSSNINQYTQHVVDCITKICTTYGP